MGGGLNDEGVGLKRLKGELQQLAHMWCQCNVPWDIRGAGRYSMHANVCYFLREAKEIRDVCMQAREGACCEGCLLGKLMVQVLDKQIF